MLRTQRWLRMSFGWGQGRRKIVQNDKLCYSGPLRQSPRSTDRGARRFSEEMPPDVDLKV